MGHSRVSPEAMCSLSARWPVKTHAPQLVKMHCFGPVFSFTLKCNILVQTNIWETKSSKIALDYPTVQFQSGWDRVNFKTPYPTLLSQR